MTITYIFNPFTGNFDAINDNGSGTSFDASIILTRVSNDPIVGFELLFDEYGNVLTEYQ